METMAEILYWGLEARGTVEDFEKEKLLEKKGQGEKSLEGETWKREKG